jgi:ribosomal protein S18 acetylase RimI-like enzyme
MPLRIRHLYRKAIIYGTLLTACIFIVIRLGLSGVAWGDIALLSGIIVIAVAAAYLAFEPAALWLSRAKVADKAGVPRIYGILENLGKSKGVTMPRVAVINDHMADAFVSGATRGRAIIFITSGALDEFDDNELEAILAHELESIDEMGLLIYNLAMMAFSALLIAYRMAWNSLLFRNAGFSGGMAVAKADLSDVPAAARLLIAHGMYNYVYLHRLARLAKERSPLFLAAYHDGKPVGFILGEVDDPFRRTVHICKFIVDERYRRKGIGGRLLRAFIDTIKSSGIRDCHLEVRVDNRSAISLYEKMEFKPRSSIPGFYPGGIDGVKLTRAIVKND